jgi:uncharacterized protein (TIGR03067 family)
MAALIAIAVGCSKKSDPTSNSGGTPDEVVSVDKERLQGVWAVESIDTGDPNQKLRPGDKIEDFRFHFQGDRLGKGKVDRVTQPMSFQLDDSVDPKVMTVTYLGKDGLPYNDRGPGVVSKEPAPSREWLYKFDGDDLVLAVPEHTVFSPPIPRPTDFTPYPTSAKPGEPSVMGVTIFRLKKTNENPAFEPARGGPQKK